MDADNLSGRVVSHYRIIEAIARGGMGVLYKAEDTRLGRRVAIKFFPEASISRREALKRFEREARAASSLSHPHICTIYDVGEYEGKPFIAMELLEGQNLRQLIAGQPLDQGQLVDLALQIADALDTAHAKGIVHRDIKPSNIFINTRGEAKVLDFGLVKHVLTDPMQIESATTDLTAPGARVGTFPYMSPEQALGRSIDQRSDLFSLGATLYEMATGQPAFRRDTPNQLLDAILHHDPEPVSAHRWNIHPAFLQILEKLLAKSPEERYQTAREVVSDLTALKRETQIKRALGGYSGSGRIRRQKARSSLLWVAGIPLLGAVVLLTLLFYPGNTFSFQARDWILLGDFENLTEEPALDALEVALRVGLEQSQHANIVPHSSLKAVLARMKRSPDERIDRDLGIEVCLREGITALVIGSIVKGGSAYSLSAEVIDPETHRTVFTRSTRAGARDQILDALEELIRQVREDLGESLSMIEARTVLLEKVTSANLEALRIYSRGIDRFDHGQHEEAIDFFIRAVDLDPEFAMAHSKLGSAYLMVGWSKKALEHWQTALQFSDRLTEFERLYVEGSAAWNGKPEEMIRIWTLMSRLYLDQPAGHHNLGESFLLYDNNFRKAAEAFTKATKLRNPRKMYSFTRLALCHLALGENEQAIENYRTAWDLGSGPVGIGLADAYIVSGRYSEAEDFLRHAVQAFPTPEMKLQASIRWAGLFLDQGRLQQAESSYRQATIQADSLGFERLQLEDFFGFLAALEIRGEKSILRSALRDAIEFYTGVAHLQEKRLEFNPIVRLALLGKLWARNFDASGAEEILLQMRPLVEQRPSPLWRAYLKMLEAEIALAAGRNEKAHHDLQQSLSHKDLYQTHESLARVLETVGEIEGAIEQRLWILHNKGRAFAEGSEQFGRIRIDLGILDWALSQFHLGRLYEGRNVDTAVEYYRNFLEHWGRGDNGLPILKEAKERVERLQGGRSGSSKVDFPGLPHLHQSPSRDIFSEARLQSGVFQ